jgi:DNA-binding NarL/FixJ family response regulator
MTVDTSNGETCAPTVRPSVAGDKRRTARILIVDNHPIAREGLRRIIAGEDDLLVCAETDTARGAHAAIKETRPHVVIADISLNQGNGVDLVREVRAHHPQLPILVLSVHDEAIYAERLLSVGANGYLTKQATSEQILYSLRRVIDGGICVSETVATNLIRGASAGARFRAADPIDRMSGRERQVLHLIGKAFSTREIARSLNLKVKTIESHRQRIKAKLNLHSGTQLVHFAIKWVVAEHAGATA